MIGGGCDAKSAQMPSGEAYFAAPSFYRNEDSEFVQFRDLDFQNRKSIYRTRGLKDARQGSSDSGWEPQLKAEKETATAKDPMIVCRGRVGGVIRRWGVIVLLIGGLVTTAPLIRVPCYRGRDIEELRAWAAGGARGGGVEMMELESKRRRRRQQSRSTRKTDRSRDRLTLSKNHMLPWCFFLQSPVQGCSNSNRIDNDTLTTVRESTCRHAHTFDMGTLLRIDLTPAPLFHLSKESLILQGSNDH
jgi:hypothetical protein